MARPKSDNKRNAILAAAARVIVAHGLGASTAMIARDAGVANGSLFTYFETKADLFNQLYLELKAGMASAALEGLPAGVGLRDQVFHVWSNWMGWAVASPDHRRVLAQLDVSEVITPANRAAAREAMAGVAELLDRTRAGGPLRGAPAGFVSAIMNSLTDATIDFMLRDPSGAKQHCRAGFDAFWRAVG